MQVTANGHLLEDNQIGISCEFPACTCVKGKDYLRLPLEKTPGWENEPIFLCDTHAVGHVPFPGADKDGIFYYR